MRVAITILVVVVSGLAASFWLSRAEPSTFTVDRYQSSEIDEASGLVPSFKNKGVFWTHNDSGDRPRVFATTVTGRVIAEFAIDGAQAVDWETITADSSGFLYIGDIGNNNNTRRDLVFYRVREPKVQGTDGQVTVDRSFRFHYPEQKAFPDKAQLNFDAEASFWGRHPKTGKGTLYVLTKHRSDQRTQLYRFDRLETESSVPLVKIGEYDLGGDPRNFGGMATGAAITEDERYLAVLSYHAVFVFERPKNGDNYLRHLRNRIDLKQSHTQQVEAIAWDGQDLVFTNEQAMIFRLTDPLRSRSGKFPLVETHK